MKTTRDPMPLRPVDQEKFSHLSPGPRHDQRMISMIEENPKCKIFMI